MFRSSKNFFQTKIIFFVSIEAVGERVKDFSIKVLTILSGVFLLKNKALSTSRESLHCCKNLSAEPYRK